MTILLLAARTLLATVFVAAGIAKLVDPGGSRKGAIDLGAPAWLAAPIGILLPVTEIVVAALLVPDRSAWWGGVGALALLLAFLAVVGISLARGRKPTCRCFGQLHARPIGWPTLARNGVLALVALLIVRAGPHDAGLSVARWAAGASRTELAVLSVVLVTLCGFAFQTWLLLHLFRQHGRLLLRMDVIEGGLGVVPEHPLPEEKQHGLPLGQPAPPFVLPSLRGAPVSLDNLRRRGGALLIFVDPHCGACGALWPRIVTWQLRYGDTTGVAVLSRGSEEANRVKFKAAGVGNVLLQKDEEVADAYRVYGTPAAVFVLPEGTIGSRVVIGTDGITELVAHVMSQQGVAAGVAATAAARR